jgi:hypothetical protein
MRSKRTLRDRHRGLRVVGPGFYLWDPDVREALRMAADLGQRGTKTPARPERATTTSACSRGPRPLPGAST